MKPKERNTKQLQFWRWYIICNWETCIMSIKYIFDHSRRNIISYIRCSFAVSRNHRSSVNVILAAIREQRHTIQWVYDAITPGAMPPLRTTQIYVTFDKTIVLIQTTKRVNFSFISIDNRLRYHCKLSILPFLSNWYYSFVVRLTSPLGHRFK